MKNFVKLIEEKISNELKPEKIKIIDNSYLHQKHKFFDPDKKHLKLILDLQRIWEEKKITIIFVTHNIEEAVTLGDRVLVLSARPGSLVWEEKINLPRPRNRKSIAAKEFQNHCSVIYEKLGL